MNKIAEQIANFLGSAWVVIPFGILRAETAQAERMERQNKKIIKEVK